MKEVRIHAPDKYFEQTAGYVLSLALCAACSSGGDALGGNPDAGPTGDPSWKSELAVRQIPASKQGFSSTSLELSWKAPGGTAPSKYVVHWTDSVTSESGSVETATETVRLTGLKSKTTYQLVLTACRPECQTGTDTTTTGSTAGEIWKLTGTGNTIDGLTKIVSDGNVRIHAFRYGDDAPADLAGKIQLFYGPNSRTVRGLITGITASKATESDPTSYLSFVSHAETSGLRNPDSAATLIQMVNAGQGIPLSEALGGKVRLFFEANGKDNKTRIQWIDSKDGYVGQDYNSGAPTYCSTASEYEAQGGCAPTVAVGLEGDTVGKNPKILNARQFKIGLHTLNDWRWNGDVGTFMLFTTDSISGCSTGPTNHAYAQWDGSSWAVQYAQNGCPNLFQGVQAMHPVHLGEKRFKAYYGNTNDKTGRVESSRLPFLGPKKVIYANGERSGDKASVEFEDWELTSQARDVTYLWPDGTELDAKAEGYIDDFTYVMPTGKAELQVMYLAITDGTVVPFSASAVLQNP